MRNLPKNLCILATLAGLATIAIAAASGDRLKIPVLVGQGQAVTEKLSFDIGSGSANPFIQSTSGGVLQLSTDGTHLITVPAVTGTQSLITATESPTNKTFDSTSTLTGAKLASFTPDGTHTLTAPTTASDTLAGIASTQTLTNKTLTSPAITTPTITGGTLTALTGMALRDTSAAFDVTIGATSSTTLTAGRALTLDMVDGARTVKLAGNLSLAGALTTSGAFGITLTATNTTSVTLPTAGTLATLAGSETFTNKDLTASTNSYRAATSSVTGSISYYNEYKDAATNALSVNSGSGSLSAVAVTVRAIHSGKMVNVTSKLVFTTSGGSTISSVVSLGSGGSGVQSADRPADEIETTCTATFEGHGRLYMDVTTGGNVIMGLASDAGAIAFNANTTETLVCSVTYSIN